MLENLTNEETSTFPELEFFGQMHGTYLFAQGQGGLYIIDQHAAHEKVLYENTIKSLKTRQYDMQMVDPPIILTLNMNEELLLENIWIISRESVLR